jgi:hypothetical protein
MQQELADIIEAHGGRDYWRTLESIEIELSASGFLFTAKRVQPLRYVRMTVCIARPEVVIHDYPLPGQATRSIGDKRVEIVDADGRVVQSRTHLRVKFHELRRFFRWDTLDFAYFSGYAIWGCLTTPFLLLREGVEVTQANTAAQNGNTQLAVKFPPTFPVHSTQQEFYFDKQHRLCRLDYTAEVVGSWAKAAHFCEEYKQFGGLWLPTRRRAYPRLPGNKPFKWLTLVAIDIHNVIPHPARQAG